MNLTRNSKIVLAVAAFGAIAVAAGGSAFTASNTVAPSVLGNGNAAVSGATVTALNYTLSADKATVNAVNFVVNAIPTFAIAEVKITGNNSLDTGWLSCVTTNATHIDCDVSGASVTAADVTNTALNVH